MITCHLGNGASITAIKNGECFDTSMGLTPLAGIMMGSRCGDVDPSAVTFVAKQRNIAPEKLDVIMNKQSGLLGICGRNDLRDRKRAKERAARPAPVEPAVERTEEASHGPRAD